MYCTPCLCVTRVISYVFCTFLCIMLHTGVFLHVLHLCMYSNMFVIPYFRQRIACMAMCNLPRTGYSGMSTICAACWSDLPKSCHPVNARIWQGVSYVFDTQVGPLSFPHTWQGSAWGFKHVITSVNFTPYENSCHLLETIVRGLTCGNVWHTPTANRNEGEKCNKSIISMTVS